MAEQDQVNQGAIPPKVSPLDKPEGQAAVTPAGAAANAPRPITVRLKPAAPAVAAAPAAPAAAAAPQPLRPVDPKATSRTPVPEEVAAAAPAAIRPATVRLRPIAAPGAATEAAPRTVPGATQAITQVELSSTAPIAPVVPVQPQPQPPPPPGASPLPDGPKPLSAAQVQASKSKTSRISLDAAIGVAPAESVGPKTIRLKRPSDLMAPPAAPTVASTPLAPASARKTSRIPDSALPAEGDGSAGVTQKKTLKIKRPGGKPDAAGEAGAEGEGFPEGVQMTPISPLDFPAQKEESSVFTTIAAVCAVAAAVVLVLLTFCLGAHAVGPDAGKNAVASISGPELPWPGRIAN